MPYATIPQLQARYPSLAGKDVGQQDAELDAASEWIETYCARRFTAATSTSSNFFAAKDRYCLDLGAFELGSNAGVIVATDDGTGTYATTLSSGSYQLEPVNAPNAHPTAKPFTSIRAIGTVWPMTYTANARQERIRVTGYFGWPEVPQSVVSACMDLVAASFENPTGAKAESIDGYSVTYTNADGREIAVPGSVLTRLSGLRRGWVA